MGAASRGCFCRLIVLPVVLVLIAAAIVFFIKNKVHPSSAPSIPSTPDVDRYGTALSASLQFLQIQKGTYNPCFCIVFVYICSNSLTYVSVYWHCS